MMQENIKLIDIVVELVDARVPLSSKNPDIDDLAKNKYRLIVLNKADMADAKTTAAWQSYFEAKGFFVAKVNSQKGAGMPNYWLSAMIIDKDAMCKQVRGETEALYTPEKGKSCPTEILEAISGLNAEGRPIWKPMHLQPMYRMHEFITVSGSGRAKTNAYISGGVFDVGADIFQRGLCLPSDNKMTPEQQKRIIEVIHACFE